MIAEYMNIPFPRSRMPRLGRSLLHGHFLPAGRIGKAENIFFIIRDGRDVLVSMYYHFLIWNERNRMHPKDVLYYRQNLPFKDYNDIRGNLPEFTEFVFTHQPSIFVRFKYEGNWMSFNQKWIKFKERFNSNVIETSYEKLLNNTAGELKKILVAAGESEPEEIRIQNVVEKLSFKRQAGRNQGEENSQSFLRKGITDDWKNKFTKKTGEIFNWYAGEMLVKLGYEKNSSWVKNL